MCIVFRETWRRDTKVKMWPAPTIFTNHYMPHFTSKKMQKDSNQGLTGNCCITIRFELTTSLGWLDLQPRTSCIYALKTPGDIIRIMVIGRPQ
jgi:hypothetical protein